MATIGIDVGTSGCKAVLLSRRGIIEYTAWGTYPTHRSLDGGVSQDAETWLRALIRAGRACADAAAEGVEAISITAPAHNVVLVGGDGLPVREVMLWADARPAAIAEEIRESLGGAVSERTMVHLTAGWSLPQLAWLRRHEPATHAAATSVLPGKDYLRYRLTGARATDPTDAAGTALYDPRAGAWVPELLQIAGLRAEQVPDVRPSDAVGGGLTSAMARRLGLRAGMPVVIGATDTAAELLAARVRDAGDALVKVASTGTVVVVGSEPRPSRTLLTYPHAIPGRWYTMGATSAAATSYAWLREIVYAEATQPPEQVYREMGRRASSVPPGSGGVLFLPFLQGERTPFWDPGLRAAFLGLSAAHGREHLCRAVLEGVAMSLRMCRDELRDAGFEIRHVRLAGGGTASPLWRQIVSATLGCNARRASTAGPAAGAALLAATAVGEGRLLRLAHPLRSVPLHEEWVERYEELYAIYRQAAAMVAPISHRLGDMASSATRRD